MRAPIATLALLLCLSISTFAQDTRGAISGKVFDPAGSLVSGVPVTITNIDTNNSVPLVTNSSGYYEARLLQSGNYRVIAEAPGFKKSVRNGLAVGLGEEIAIDFKLEVGSVNESVMVTAEAPVLESDSVSTGRALTTRELMDLPVMTNNIVLQAMLAPGVQSPGTTQFLSQGYIGGSSTSYYAPGNVGGNEWSMDGQPNNGLNRNTAFTPYTDMVAEFKVETSNFDASFGHSTGLNIQMSTKSGSNQLHGTATEQYWNTRWNAAPFFVKQNYYSTIAGYLAAGNNAAAEALANSPKTAGGHSNNFGATLGGPVVIPKLFNGRNKLFFFFSFAGVRDRQPARPTDINDIVPTALNRTGNFSDLLPYGAQYTVYDPLTIKADAARATHFIRTPFPNNTIPLSRVGNPAYNFVNSHLPLPNNGTNPTGINFLAAGQVDNDNYNALNQRTDYNISEKDRLFFRWNWSHYVEYYGDYTYTGLMSADDTRQNLSGVINWTHIFTASTVLDVAVSANNWFQRLYNSGLTAYKPSDFGLPAYMDQQCKDHADCSMPVFALPGYALYTSNTIGRPLASYPRVRSQGIKSNLSHVAGRHTFRGGIDFREHVRNDIGANGNSSGNFNFANNYVRKDDDGNSPAASIGLSWASFMLGIPTSASVDNNASISEINPYYGWYGQDTWRVRNNLTITLGLRMEYEMGPHERYDRALTYFDPKIQLPITALAQSAYTAKPVPQVPAISVLGGNVYAGLNGAPRRLWRNELMWLPRASLAWQPARKWVVRGGYGIYYDTLNVMNEAANQSGFSRSTSTTISNNFGQTWAVGNPAAGISPLTDPFPVRADGTRFNQPFGNSFGSMYQVGQGFTFTPYEREHPRVQKWRAGFQYQLGSDSRVEISYWGQYSDRIGITKKLDSLPGENWNSTNQRNNTISGNLNANVTSPFYLPNFVSLQSSNPTLYNQMSTLGFFTSSTVQLNRLMRLYPQMNGLNEANAPFGTGTIKAVEANYSKRMGKGLNLNASFTWMDPRQATIYSNEFDANPTSYGSNNGRPRRLTLSGIYEMPFGPNRRFFQHGPVAWLIGSWQMAATYQYQPGDLLNFGTNDFYYGSLNGRDMAAAINKGSFNLDQWFNTTAPFERTAANGPANYQTRILPQYIDGVRGDKMSVVNMNLRRDFNIRERLKLQLRLDALNLQNRSQFSDPDTNPFNSTFGKVPGQTNSVNRFYDIQMRIQF